MRAVLGIDAAWTPTQPSGVALVTDGPDGWRLVAAEASYQRFQALAFPEGRPEARPSGSVPSAPTLLRTARALAGRTVDVVAVDMPLSRAPITCRRESDNQVSRLYGGRKCGTHSPSAARPGQMSDQLREAFESAGYSLGTTDVTLPGLYEVYPHPALVELTGASERLPYKAAKAGKYWPLLAPAERRLQIGQQWNIIVAALDARISGVAARFQPIQLTEPGWVWKAFEDALDAVVCAWVGICILEGRAVPFGDATSAIWIPISGPTATAN